MRFSLDIAGQHHEVNVPDAGVGTTYTFEWDGNDAWGRPAQGPVLAKVGAGFGYAGVYVSRRSGGGVTTRVVSSLPPDFAAWPAGDNVVLGPARQSAYLMTYTKGAVGEWTQQGGLGGLGLDILHGYSALPGTVFLGDGSLYRVGDYGLRVGWAGGGGASRADGATWATADLVTATGLTEAAGGALVYVESNRRVRKLAKSGVVETLAGQTTTGFAGDGLPGAQAQFSGIDSVATGPDGTLYVADSNNHRLRAVDAATGLVRTVVGTGTQGFSPNGTAALQAKLDTVRTVFVTRAGEVHFFTRGTDGRAQLRRLRNGLIETVAGGAATETLEAALPTGVTFRDFARSVAEGPDGSLYIASYESAYVVRRIWPDGRVDIIAGGGPSRLPDETDAKATCFSGLSGVAVDRLGNVFLAEPGGTGCGVRGAGIRVISPDGRLATAAGFMLSPGNRPTRPYQPMPTTGLATATGLYNVHDVILLRTGKLAFVHHGDADTVHTLESPVAMDLGITAVPSRDGRSLYLFDVAGRHQETRDAVTGRVLWHFEWTAAGLLSSIVDGDGNRTKVQRDPSGKPTGLEAPDGQVTALGLDTQGRVTSVTDSEGRVTGLGYGARGLLESSTDANGHTARFAYDGEGRLLTDTNARGNTKTLARESYFGGETVTFTTPEGRKTVYQQERSGPTRQYTTTLPDGTKLGLAQAGAAIGTTSPDGTQTSVLAVADPRFGTPLATPATFEVDLPSGLVMKGSSTRTVALDGGLMAVAKWTDTDTVNGKTWTTDYTAADSTWRTTSPLGRTSSVTLDSSGRPSTLTRPGLLPVTVTYDARGRVTTTTQGTRSSALAYGANGFLSSSTDALSKKTSMATDSTGWTSSVTRPDGKAVGFSWDKAGNLSSLTPPGKPAHAQQLRTLIEAEGRLIVVALRRPIYRRAPRVG